MVSPQPVPPRPSRSRRPPRPPRTPRAAGRSGAHPGRWIALAVAVALAIAYVIFVGVWTDKLWFDSVGYGRVFATQLGTAAALATAGFLLTGGLVAAAMTTAYRARPARPQPVASPIAQRTREVLGGAARWLIAAPALLAGLLGAAVASGQVERFLAFANAQPFGVADPTFHLDASFYVFAYPWWRFVTSFAMTVLVLAFLAALVVGYVTGGLGLRPRTATRTGTWDRASASLPLRIELCGLVALLLVVFGLGKLLDRVQFPITDNALFTGVAYTDDHARINAALVIGIIAFLCAGLALAMIWVKRVILPAAGVVLMVVSSVIISSLYPMLLQTITVKPSEPGREAPYITRHIAATRAAYGVDHVQVVDYSAKTTASAGQLRSDAAALPGIRLIDPAVVARTFDQLQQVRGFYTFPSVLDVDRYTIDGKQTDAVVAAREIDPSGLPDKQWNNVHTVYTHGFGLVAAYGNQRQPGGEPQWIAKDLPPTGALTQTQARIYYGELTTDYAIVGAKPGAAPIELDTPGGGQQTGEQNTTYTGKGGVSLASPIARLAYATRFADANILLSDRVSAASRILYDRTPADRVQQVAPWLTPDQDPYPTLVDGRLVFVVDCYTTTNNYPNSERIGLQSAAFDRQSAQEQNAASPDTDQRINYIRNSVKAVVDAYDGTVSLYEWDSADPILKTWEKVYPGTVQPRSAISPDLLSHLRYPQDLYKVQREILGRYHMTNSDSWYNQADLWVVPSDPVAAKVDPKNTGLKESAYYLSVKWPGDPAPVFSLTSVFVPNNRANLAAYMSVNADASSPSYGQLRVLRMSDTQQIDGPGQSFNAMTTNEAVADRLRPFLNQGSAKAVYGNLLTIPLGGGLMYVEPVYTEREGGTAYPALRFVIVKFGDHVAIGETLQDALDQVFQGDSGGSTNEGSGSGGGTGGTTGGTQGPSDPAAVAAALGQARQAFADADAALKAGDLATYQKKIAEAQAAVERAYQANGGK